MLQFILSILAATRVFFRSGSDIALQVLAPPTAGRGAQAQTAAGLP